MPYKNTKSIGDAGQNEFAINSNRSVEYLEELQGRTGSINLRRIAKGDPIIGMILRVHKNPIRSAAWNIPYPADATDDEKMAIDLIKNRLFGESGTEFDCLLGKILSMLEYGFSLFELYYNAVKVDGNMYLMPVIEQRMQTSIEDIFPDKGFVRQLTIDRGLVSIPFSNLLFFILNQQGDDMRGESLLRNAYGSCKEKRTYREWRGIGIQRSVSGIPSMQVPKGVKITDPDYVAAELLLKSVCQHENAYMITQEGWNFKIEESKFNADQVQKCIDACNTEMAMSVLIQFMLLGQNGNTGAYALSRDQSDFFLDGLQYIVNLVSGVINRSVITPFLNINFGDKIDHSRVCLYAMNLNKKAGKELAETLSALKTAGFIRPTQDDEIQLRSNLEMPELTEEEIENRKKDPTPPPEPQLLEGAVKFAEQKNIVRKERQEYIVNSEKEMSDFMKANLMLIKDKLIADIETTLNRGTVEIKGLNNIEISSSKYIKGLQMKLAGVASDSWNRAKKSAKANVVKFSDIDPKNIKDAVLKQFVINQADSIVSKQTSGMLNRAVLTASNNSLKGLSIAQTISNTSRAIDDFISSSGIVVDGSLVVVGTANFGETQFYKEISDQLWGYRFVGINDDVQSEICRWYDGKTFSVNSPELSQATPPLHPNCRSYLEPIYKSEVEPNIDNVIAPPSVQSGKTFY